MIKYIALDTETGGFDYKKHPVLTAYFAIVGEDFKIIDELELDILPESPYDVVEAGALKVNGIDLELHKKVALSKTEASVRLSNFLKAHHNGGKNHKLRPLGQNLPFDYDFVWEQLISKEEWSKRVHYVSYDTKSIADFLKLAGILPQEVGNLASLVQHYQIDNLSFHTAKGDVQMTIKVLQKMVSSMRFRQTTIR